MRIELLQGNLPVSGNHELNASDFRFDEIATLVQAGHYEKAASLSEEIFVDKIYDIRIICYFLYGYWLEQGLLSLDEVICTLNQIILKNWETISPVSKREKNTQSSLNWLFQQVLKKSQFEERRNTVLWQHWQASIHIEDVDKLLESSETFRLNIKDQIQDSNVDSVIKVEIWLRAFQRLLNHSPALEQVESVKLEAPEINTIEVKNIVSVPAVINDSMKIEFSHHMQLFLKKLAAFEYLLQEQNFPKAAVVADDINQTLANFDPTVYFPKTFETFAKLKVLNFEKLSLYENQRGSPQWQAMQAWLKIDVDGFKNN